jgi:hypothetical protein
MRAKQLAFAVVTCDTACHDWDGLRTGQGAGPPRLDNSAYAWTFPAGSAGLAAANNFIGFLRQANPGLRAWLATCNALPSYN